MISTSLQFSMAMCLAVAVTHAPMVIYSAHFFVHPLYYIIVIYIAAAMLTGVVQRLQCKVCTYVCWQRVITILTDIRCQIYKSSNVTTLYTGEPTGARLAI